MQGGAVVIVGIGGAGLAERRDRGLALAALLADVAKCEPGGGEFRRQLHRLLEQVGGGGEIALQLQVAREFIAAVGHEIAGGQEQAGGHFLGNRSRHGRARPGHPSKRRLFRKMDARVKPAHDG